MKNKKIAPIALAASLAATNTASHANENIAYAKNDTSRKVENSLNVRSIGNGISVSNNGKNSVVGASVEALKNSTIVGLNAGYYNGQKGIFIEAKNGNETSSIFATGTYNGENISSKGTIGKMQKELSGKKVSQFFVGAEVDAKVTSKTFFGVYGNKTNTQSVNLANWQETKNVVDGTEVTDYSRDFQGNGKSAAGVQVKYFPTERDEISSKLGYSKTNNKENVDFSAKYSHLSEDFRTKTGVKISGNNSGNLNYSANVSRKVSKNSEVGLEAGRRGYGEQKENYVGAFYTYHFDANSGKYSSFSGSKNNFNPYSHVVGADEASRVLYGAEKLSKNTVFIPELDTKAPEFLNGMKSQTYRIKVGQDFIPRQLSGIDNVDGNLEATMTVVGSKLKANGSVDTSKAGTVKLVYVLRDKAGNVATLEDNLIIEEAQKPVPPVQPQPKPQPAPKPTPPVQPQPKPAPEKQEPAPVPENIEINVIETSEIKSGDPFKLDISTNEGAVLIVENLPKGLKVEGKSIVGTPEELTTSEGTNVKIISTKGKNTVEKTTNIKIYRTRIGAIPFQTKRIPNDNLEKGKEEVKEKGMSGLQNFKVWASKENPKGVEEIPGMVIEKPKDEIIEFGTASAPEKAPIQIPEYLKFENLMVNFEGPVKKGKVGKNFFTYFMLVEKKVNKEGGRRVYNNQLDIEVTGLPKGLKFEDGILEGIPEEKTDENGATVVFTVKNGLETMTKSLTIIIEGEPKPEKPKEEIEEPKEDNVRITDDRDNYITDWHFKMKVGEQRQLGIFWDTKKYIEHEKFNESVYHYNSNGYDIYSDEPKTLKLRFRLVDKKTGEKTEYYTLTVEITE